MRALRRAGAGAVAFHGVGDEAFHPARRGSLRLVFLVAYLSTCLLIIHKILGVRVAS